MKMGARGVSLPVACRRPRPSPQRRRMSARVPRLGHAKGMEQRLVRCWQPPRTEHPPCMPLGRVGLMRKAYSRVIGSLCTFAPFRTLAITSMPTNHPMRRQLAISRQSSAWPTPGLPPRWSLTIRQLKKSYWVSSSGITKVPWFGLFVCRYRNRYRLVRRNCAVPSAIKHAHPKVVTHLRDSIGV